MSNKKDFLKNYIASKKELMKHFKCDDDFFIKPLEIAIDCVKTAFIFSNANFAVEE